ncbi:MAG: hypothetical protein WC376_00755 [Candidatus Nanoarchaeia archaeon]|jgi:hypothetical protein
MKWYHGVLIIGIIYFLISNLNSDVISDSNSEVTGLITASSNPLSTYELEDIFMSMSVEGAYDYRTQLFEGDAYYAFSDLFPLNSEWEYVYTPLGYDENMNYHNPKDFCHAGSSQGENVNYVYCSFPVKITPVSNDGTIGIVKTINLNVKIDSYCFREPFPYCVFTIKE